MSFVSKRPFVLSLAGIGILSGCLYWQYQNFAFSLDSEFLLFLLKYSALVITLGMLLGLFFQRKERYFKRISFTIPLSLLVISCSLFFGISYYEVEQEFGFYGQYNQWTAVDDIQKGRVQLVTFGLEMPGENDNRQAEESITREFGFVYYNAGCVISDNGYIRYNKIMADFLEQRNGRGWQKRLRNRLNSLYEKK